MASLRFRPVVRSNARVAKPLCVTITASPGSLPPPAVPLAEDERATLYNTSTGWEWHGTSYHLVAHTADPSIRIVLHTSHSDLSGLNRRLILAYAVRHVATSMLPHTGWMPLHGGALEAPSGEGVLIVGPSGSGKSTLSAGLVLRGWACVSDDLLILSSYAPGEDRPQTSPSGTVRIEGLTTDIRLRQDVSEQLHDALSKRSHPTGQSSPAVAYGAETKCGYRAAAHPATHARLLVLPSITDAPVSRLEPVSSYAGLRAVLKQMPPIAIARRVLQTAGDLVRPCSCVRLHAGRDLYDDPGALEDLLAPHLP